MKLILQFLTYLFILSIALSTALLRPRHHKKPKNDFDLTYTDPITDKWTEEMAREYRNMAGLGYVEKSSSTMQMNVIMKGLQLEKMIQTKGFSSFEKQELISKYKKATGGTIPVRESKNLSILFYKLFYVQRWELIETYSDDKDQYKTFDYTVIVHHRKQRIVCTFSGSKGINQLSSQAWNSDGVQYKEVPNANIQIMRYFYELYEQQVKENFIKTMNAVYEKIGKDKVKDYQIVFVGHSLGGAMATVVAFDSVVTKLVPRSNNSPCLITYGQPRTGNYVFANEVMKAIPIVYRHVNMWDMVTNIPACKSDGQGNCINEYNQTKLNKNLSVFKITDDRKDIELEPRLFHFSSIKKIKDKIELHFYKKEEPTPEGVKEQFNPWHIGGMVFIKPLNMHENTFKYVQCGDYEQRRIENNKECENASSSFMVYHKVYFDYKISALGDPSIYPAEKTINVKESYLMPTPLNYLVSKLSNLMDGTILKTIKTTGLLLHKKRKMRRIKKMRKMRKMRKFK